MTDNPIGSLGAELAASRAQAKAFEHGFAHVLFEKLVGQIGEYEKTLKKDEEVGAFLASFGTQILIQIEEVTYENPYFLIFSGTNMANNSKIRLVQHVTQVNVLFTSIKITDLKREPRRIGFLPEA